MNQVRALVMEVIILSPGGLLEKDMIDCPGLTWTRSLPNSIA